MSATETPTRGTERGRRERPRQPGGADGVGAAADELRHEVAREREQRAAEDRGDLVRATRAQPGAHAERRDERVQREEKIDAARVGQGEDDVERVEDAGLHHAGERAAEAEPRVPQRQLAGEHALAQIGLERIGELERVAQPERAIEGERRQQENADRHEHRRPDCATERVACHP